MLDVVLHRLAEKDFATAFNWYAERSDQAALAFDQEVNEAIEQIANDPERQQRLDPRHQYRLLRQFPYLVVFRRRDESAIVVAIAHARQRVYWMHRS